MLIGLFRRGGHRAADGLPKELVVAIAGLALLGSIGGGLHTALADERHREAALITFLVTLSGVVVAGGARPQGVVAARRWRCRTWWPAPRHGGLTGALPAERPFPDRPPAAVKTMNRFCCRSCRVVQSLQRFHLRDDARGPAARAHGGGGASRATGPVRAASRSRATVVHLRLLDITPRSPPRPPALVRGSGCPAFADTTAGRVHAGARR